MSAGEDPDEVRREFAEAVNLTPAQLEQWLETDQSKQVGQKPEGGGESTGHESGRRIVQILRTSEGELTDDDLAHMRTVVGYVQRHAAQRPDKPADELAGTAWAASLKNWGHDPLR